MMRKPAAFLLGLILGAAFGAFLGYLIFPRELNLQKEGIPPRSELQQNDGGRELATASRASGAENINITNTPAPGSSGRETAAPRAEVKIKKETGTGKITGRIVDAAGNPMEGVMLTLKGWGAPPPPARRVEPGETPPLDRILQEATEKFERDESVIWRAVSGGDGNFNFTNLPDDHFAIYAQKSGFEIKPRNGKYTNLRIGTNVDLVAVAKLRVPVIVKMPDGTEPKACSIQGYYNYRGSSFSVYCLWTAAERMIELTPGNYHLSASLSAGRPGEALTSESADLLLEDGVAPATVLFELREKLKIQGRVDYEDPDEDPLVALYLSVHSAENSADMQRIKSGGRVTSVQDEYSFSDVKPGKYDIGVARRTGDPIVACATVELTNTTVTQNFKIPARRAEEFIIVKTVGPNGRPVSGLGFWISGSAGREYSKVQSPSIQKSSGDYWLTIPSKFDAAFAGKGDAGRGITLEVDSDLYGSVAIPLEPNQRNIEINYSAPARLKIQMTQFNGSGLENALSVRIRDAKDFICGYREVDADGIVEIKPIQPGTYQLEISVRAIVTGSRGPEFIVASSTSVALQSGENTIHVATPEAGGVTVRVPGVKQGEMVDLNYTDKHSRNMIVRARVEDSAVKFQNIPHGNYKITYYHPVKGRQEMNVQIPSAGEITFPAESNKTEVK